MATLALDYSSSTGFLFDTSKIAFTGALANLAKSISTDIVFYAGLHSSLAGDYSRDGGLLTTTSHGSPSISGGKLVLNSGNSYLDFSNIKNGPMLSTLTVKFKVTTLYAGTPSTPQYILTITGTNASDLNRVIIAHNNDGLLYFQGQNAAGVSFNVSASWSPVINTEYEIALVMDWVNNIHLALIGGVVHNTASVATGPRNFACGLIRLGDAYDGATGNNAQVAVRDLIIYDSVLYTGNYSAGYSLPSIYSTTAATVQSTSAQLASAWSAFSVSQSASGSDTIRHSPIIDGVRKYLDGSAWVTASAGQTNTAAEINSNCSSLIASGTNSTIDLISYLTSADGSTTPTLTSATITYTAALSLTDYPVATDVRSLTVYKNGKLTGTMSNVTNIMATASLDPVSPLTADLEEVS